MRFPLTGGTAQSAAGALALLLAAGAALAQQPSSQQISAIRANCRSDFMANCSGVTPGGKDALECLKRNVAKLSGGCKTAVSAISSPAAPAAPAAAAPPPAPPPAAASAPAPAPAMAPPAPKPAPKPTTAHAAPAAPAKPTAAQTNAVRSACRSDFMTHCSGVTPGGAEALACLKHNAAHLSAACHSAVAAIGGTAAAEPAPAAAPATAGFPQLGPVRPVLPRRAMMIVGLCRADAQTLCPGIPPGGGRILDCLAQNSPRLSPECYKALAPITLNR